jgi:hypothetical protein
MRTRLSAWYDTENDRVLYGVKAHANGHWCNVAEAGVACIYETKAEAEAKRKEIRKWPASPSLPETP